MKKNPCLQVALDELESVGIRDVTIAHGGNGHIQLRWKVGEREIRQVLRTDGMLPEREPKAPPQRLPSRLEVLTQRVAALEQRLAKLEAER
jgi:uridine phosphorylase